MVWQIGATGRFRRTDHSNKVSVSSGLRLDDIACKYADCLPVETVVFRQCFEAEYAMMDVLVELVENFKRVEIQSSSLSISETRQLQSKPITGSIGQVLPNAQIQFSRLYRSMTQ